MRRYAGYMFWSAGAFALPVALERLVVCPLLRHHLGDEQFGGFVWLLGVMNVLGLATTAGFSSYLLRSLASQDVARAQALLRMSLLLAVLIGVPVIALGSLASYRFADEYVRASALALYVPLGAFAVFRCLETVLITTLRIKRWFATIFVLKAFEAAILLIILLIAQWQNIALIGGVYIASVAFPLLLITFLSRTDIGRGPWWSAGLTGTLLVAWAGLSLPALIEQSLAYSPRIFLGAAQGSAAVTVLFAGTSIGNVFVMPVGLAGGLVLSLLGSRRDFALAGRRGYLYLGICAFCAMAAGSCSYLAGKWLIRLLYPEVAGETLAFYHWIALANTAAAAIVLIRPVALKYARIRNVATLSLGSLLLQWVALALLVPSHGPAGAAIALALSAFVGLTLWLGCYVQLLRARSAATETEPLDFTESPS